MTRTSVVQDYKHPQPGTTSTLTIDEKVQREIRENGIHRPKGYTVSYHANPEMEKMHFGPKHPMKPWRLTLTNKIVLAYGMHQAMDVYIPRAATPQELKAFHRDDYIDFLQRWQPWVSVVLISFINAVVESLHLTPLSTSKLRPMLTTPVMTVPYSMVSTNTAPPMPAPL